MEAILALTLASGTCLFVAETNQSMSARLTIERGHVHQAQQDYEASCRVLGAMVDGRD
ncbi:hypothetical protein [Furfurilactobacillus entadae]|uniref:hypothetical protein n=1 Tax=Furfurilactobacillus entadae TaxID=2922307 RepID=UPI0038B2AD8A